jgi:hypothetical protein
MGGSLLLICQRTTRAIQSFCKQFLITPCTLLTAGGACPLLQTCLSIGACITVMFHRLMASTLGMQMSKDK